jgi:hypothetical protein
MRRLVLGAGLLLLSLNLSNVAHAESRIEFSYMGWQGKARFERESGVFTRCTVSSNYKSNINLSFSIERTGSMEVWMENRGWRLDSSEKYPVTLRVDRLTVHRSKLNVLADQIGYIPINKSLTFFEELRRGRRLVVVGNGPPLEFDLGGTSVALQKLRKCWKAYAELPGQSPNPFSQRKTTNPFSKDGRNKPKFSRSTEESKSENAASEFARLILANLDQRDFELINNPPDSIKKLRPSLYWLVPNGFGMAQLIEFNIDLATRVEIIERGDKKSCLGTFSVSSRVRRISQSQTAHSIQANCESGEDGLEYFVIYTDFPKNGGGVIRISHLGYTLESALNADLFFFEEVKRQMSGQDGKVRSSLH